MAHSGRPGPTGKALLLAGSIAAFSTQAHAGEEPISDGDDVIVVTAQRRTTLLQETPIAISAFSGAELRERQIDQMAGLATAVPNVQLFDLAGGGVPIVIIRGVGLRNTRINDTPTTAVYVDEVYQANIAQLQGTSFDLERVEILKGPQGGLFGRNSVGGAIQFISTKPELGKFTGYATASVARFEEVNLEAATSIPLGDTAAVRVSGKLVRSGDTYFRSVTGNFRHGEQDRWGLRAIGLWQPTDALEVTLKLQGGADRSELPLNRPVAGWEPSGRSPVPGRSLASLRNIYCTSLLSGGPREPGRCTLVNGTTPASIGVNGRYDGAGLGRNRLRMDWFGGSLILAGDFGLLSVKSITSYDELNYARILDQDAIVNVQQEVDYISRVEVWSQEFRLDLPITDRVKGLFGVVLGGDTVTENTRLVAQDGIIPFAFRVNLLEQPYLQKTNSFAGYGRLDIDVTDRLSLAIEVRQTLDDKSFEGGQFFPASGSFNSPVSGELLFLQESRSFSATTGKIVADYTLDDGLLLYGSVARGFKTGGYYGGIVTRAAQLASYDNEYITAFEGGLKGEWFDRRLRVNAAVFHYLRSDVQQQGSEIGSGVTVDTLRNIGDATSTGAEVDVLAILTPEFRIGAAFGWITSKITKSDFLVASIFGGTNSPVGARLPQQPEFSGNLFARYERAVSDKLEASLQVDYSFQSNSDLEFAVTGAEKNFLREGAYGLLDAQVRLGTIDKGWTVGAFMKNITETKYRVVARDVTSGGFNEIWGAPRTWGVTLGFSW